MNLSNAPKAALGYEKLTVSTTAVGLASIPSGAQYAVMRVETAALRYRDDGTAPTASEGMKLDIDDTLEYSGDIKRFKAIRKDASDATLFVLYYGP